MGAPSPDLSVLRDYLLAHDVDPGQTVESTLHAAAQLPGAALLAIPVWLAHRWTAPRWSQLRDMHHAALLIATAAGVAPDSARTRISDSAVWYVVAVGFSCATPPFFVDSIKSIVDIPDGASVPSPIPTGWTLVDRHLMRTWP